MNIYRLPVHSVGSRAAPKRGGNTGKSSAGLRVAAWLGCCQNDWGRARNFIGNGSGKKEYKLNSGNYTILSKLVFIENVYYMHPCLRYS